MKNKVKIVLKKFFTAFHKVLYFFIRFFQPIRNGRNVLLYCNSDTMEPHILDYYSIISDYKTINWYVFYPNLDKEKMSNTFQQMIVSTKVHVIKNRIQLFFSSFDLIVNADIFFLPCCNYQQCPRLYVNHGLHIISYNGGDSLYAYGEGAKNQFGEPVFTKMFEPNASIVEKVVQNDLSFQNVIVHTGYKFFEKIEEEMGRYYFYRQQFGIDDNETFVSIFGSWNKDSLFHVLGPDLLKEAKKLQSSGFRFMLSIHPREYIRYDDTVDPLGEKIVMSRAEGFLVRSPDEEWLPYLVASDIVICDYSSMYELAIMAKKKLIFSFFPHERVWKHSIAARIFDDMPILKSADELSKLLAITKDSPLNPAILKFREEVKAPKSFKYEEIVRQETENLLKLKLYKR